MKNETKLFLGIIVGTVVVIAAGILLLSKSGTASTEKADPTLLVRADSERISTASATVTLVEFGDFECPACAAYHPIVKKIMADFAGNLTLVFRNFPLDSIHKNAHIAAQAAEAAGKQGKYWEMYNWLYEHGPDWTQSNAPMDVFAAQAKTMGLDVEKFRKDTDSDEVKNFITRDINDSNSLGVNATPTFYLDGVKLENPATIDEFESLVRSEIAKVPAASPGAGK